ncbi:MAG TPA: putative sulfate exporter family transporter, partial [Acidimicrobiales bacterium]|nr:putative sulfate exporter family transporter [Acidimicrobiales bacterium]
MTTTATVPAPPSSGRLPDPAPCRDRTLLHLLPGVALCGAVAAVACVVGPRVPSLGSPVVALLMGIGLAGVLPPGATARAGVRFVGRHGLQVGIVALGFGVSLHEVASTGFRSLPVMVPTFAVALVGARCFGGALGLGRVVRGLIGVGTAVCGASAIAAVAPVIAADEADVASAVSTIFVFNVAAVLLFPWVGHLLGLSQRSFGLWAGTAVNDTSSVVAAAFAYGHVAGAHAVVVKLTRSMAIVPICLVL